MLRFEIAKARTTLENDRTLEEARADGNFEAAFTEGQEHRYVLEEGRWRESERRKDDAFVDWLRGGTAWHAYEDRFHGLPQGMILKKVPDPLAGC